MILAWRSLVPLGSKSSGPKSTSLNSIPLSLRLLPLRISTPCNSEKQTPSCPSDYEESPLVWAMVQQRNLSLSRKERIIHKLLVAVLSDLMISLVR
jgi:hypothetical protein